METILNEIIEYAKCKSLDEVSSYIYSKYANNNNTETAKLDLKYSQKKEVHVFDLGWYYEVSKESYFRKINKFLLKKGSEFVTVSPEEFIYDYKNSADLNSRYVKIQIRKYEKYEGWHWIIGNNYLGFTNRNRLYFSFKNDESVKKKILQFINELSFQLNQTELAFKIKFEENISERHENAVLYFNKSHYFLVFLIVKKLHFKFHKIFREVNSFPFVKKFKNYPGIAFAENPNNTYFSFGENISQIIAEAIVLNGRNTISKLSSYLKRLGYNSSTLYLNPFSNFSYNFEIFENQDNVSEFIKIDKIKNSEKIVLYKIVLAILKNALIFGIKKPKCIWLLAKDDKIPPNTIEFEICNNESMLEILTFLSSYLKSLPNILSDILTYEIAKIGLHSIVESKLDSENRKLFKRLKSILDPKFGGKNVSMEVVLNLQNGNDESALSAFNKIKDNLKIRSIVSYIEGDEFIPTITENGYSFIGMYIIKNFYRH